jgi:tRNA-dihydrouridine synthase B
VREWLLEHLDEHYSLYGEVTGVRTARKHIGWYVKALPNSDEFRDYMNTLQTSQEQVMAVATFFDTLRGSHEYLQSSAIETNTQINETFVEEIV